MKKIILILFLFLSCYLIYNLTDEKELSCLVIGDSIADNNYLQQNPLLTSYNNSYINEDYRVIDLLNIIKYNEEHQTNNKTISIHRLLNTTDILIISIGMNDIYYKLNNDTKNIYTYINNMINDIELLLVEINKYNYKQVLFLGPYNINNKYQDIFIYTNYKLKRIINKYHYTYIDLNNIIDNNQNYLVNNQNFTLNDTGYNKISEIIVENLKKY